MVNNDPLQKLVIDVTELDKEKLRSLLVDYLAISKEGQIVVLPNFSQLSTTNKILAIVLARRAAHALGLSEKDLISPKEIEEKTGIPGGTVRRELGELRDKRLLINIKGSYSVPNYAIPNISMESLIKGQSSSVRALRKGERRSTKPMASKSDRLQKLLQISQESIKPNLLNLMLAPGLYLERSLTVLKLARENEVDGLTPAEITAFLKEKIRAGGIYKENISYALGKKGTRYVDRFPDPSGKGYIYKIMVSGEKLLENKLAEKHEGGDGEKTE